MNYNKMIPTFKKIVADYIRAELLNGSDETVFKNDDVYIVWYCKTLKNAKALLSTDLPDGRYYEVTYNGEKDEYYFDAYKKEKNKCIVIEDWEE